MKGKNEKNESLDVDWLEIKYHIPYIKTECTYEQSQYQEKISSVCNELSRGIVYIGKQIKVRYIEILCNK